MLQNNYDKSETSYEAQFECEICNQCIERITYLQELILIEEEKLFKALEEVEL